MTTLPTIHLNGTGAESLFYEYHDAWQALKKARIALAETTCNARDFYPQGDEAWHQARFERAEALAKLDDAIGFAEAWVEHTNINH
jgi:hypothetical protein